MLALQAWRDEHICPLCGWPKAVCQDPAREFDTEVPAPTRCHITTALRRAQKAYGEQQGANPEGLLWAAQLKS